MAELICASALLGQIKDLTRRANSLPVFRENRQILRELRDLAKSAGGLYFATPMLAEKLAALDDIDEAAVARTVKRERAERFVAEEELESLIPLTKFILIKSAADDRDDPEKYIRRIYRLRELDPRSGEKLSAMHEEFSRDRTYLESDIDTRADYRATAALIAREAQLDQRKYIAELVKSKDIGAAIDADLRRVFPYANERLYIAMLFAVSGLLSLAAGYFTRIWYAPLLFFPIFTAVKPIFDSALSRFTYAKRLPRTETKDKLPENGRTLCVMTTLVEDEKALSRALSRLKEAKLRNPQEGIFFALLCDLKAANSERTEEDELLISSVERIRNEIFPEAMIFVRERTFCRTMRKWQGHERKRGAIEELCGFMCGRRNNFRVTSGNAEAARQCEFICALDLDTTPLMDSVKELAAIALHPLNERYGIIAPRIGNDLGSTLKTGFSRAMAENGGASGISAYDNFCGEFYFDCFGEGIFCGKGLLRKERFLAACEKKFPNERILSHDILEGGMAKVAFAGDVEFSDSFPESSRGYFSRAERWTRGDFQNLRFLFKKEFSPLTRFKLFDNFRRGISPLFTMLLFFISCFEGSGVLSLAAYSSVLLPFVTPFVCAAAGGFASRKFYSPVLSKAKQLALRAVMELITLPISAVTAFCAGIKALWRMAVSKRNLLQWTVSSAFFGKERGASHLIVPFAVSLALLCCSAVNFSPAFFAGLAMCGGIPFILYADKPRESGAPALDTPAREELLDQVKKMWSFYETYVTEETNYLPPDNVQYFPVYRVCPRTSPTNIGMYLLSAAAVFKLGIINSDRFIDAAEKTLSTLEKMKKWHGNLFNWYDIYTLELVSDFVSSVDSGNFLCCLEAVYQAVATVGEPKLETRLRKILDGAELSRFYVKKRDLFSIGYSLNEGKLSEHKYDMLMSEARLMSYYAIATGQAPKKHWRALSRTMSRRGRYAGAIAWTGTMFEFYMPELLLSSKEGSVSYEALKYAFYCQKRASDPFGISESGYFAFDRDRNFRYKAHGAQKTALKAGMDSERVVSPYSSYLTLAREPLESWNNLVKLYGEGAYDERFGFYEAIDYTEWRVNKKAIVKSHMAHHVGMSIAGAANALDDNVCSRLFMKSDKIRRAEELLEERIMSGEKILKITEYKRDKEPDPAESEAFSRQTLFRSPVNALGGGELALFACANGLFCGNYRSYMTVRMTRDYLERPAGAFYGYLDGEKIYPFFYHPSCPAALNTLFTPESAVYSLPNGEENADFDLEMALYAGENVEFRRFSAKNNTREKKALTLCCFSEPVLAGKDDYFAHPMFMDLFLKMEYDEKNRLFIFYRKERHGEDIAACAAGFVGEEDFTFSFNREKCTDCEPFSFFKYGKIRENDGSGVPSPCLFIKAEISLEPDERRAQELFYCYGNSVEEARKRALETRKNGFKPSLSLNLPKGTMHGRMAEKALPALLYGEKSDISGRSGKIDKSALWQYGISGDLPILLFEYGERSAASAALMKQGLERCGINADLVVLCGSGLERTMALRELDGSGTALIKKEIGEETVLLLYALAADIVSRDEESERLISASDILPVIPCAGKGEMSGFREGSYIVSERNKIWCNVLANESFGTLASNGSLGFTWAGNSRENRLSAWSNDIVRDNFGESLLMRVGGKYVDLVRGSDAEFSPDSCIYRGSFEKISSEACVRVYAEKNGKEITLRLGNLSDEEISVKACFKIIPDFRAECEEQNGALVIKNTLNGRFKGDWAVYCGGEARFCTDKYDFAAGRYHGVSRDRCDIAAVIVPLKLPPRGSERIRFILGYAENAAEYVKEIGGSPTEYRAENEIKIKTPDGSLDQLFNVWLPHQTLKCRMWARTGFFQNGGAVGFRDQLQDCLAVMYFSPSVAREHIWRCCESQFPEGDVLHWFHEFDSEKTGVRTRYSDDLLWLPYAACEFYSVYGESGFWDRELRYCEGEDLPEGKAELFMRVNASQTSESLYLHCKRAMEKAFSRGENGLLLIGGGDWNDGYNNVGIEGKGESVWLTMFYIMCARSFVKAAKLNDDGAYGEKLEKRAAELAVCVEENAWENDRYLRAFYDDGTKMGSESSDSCRIDILPQAFAVLCGLPDKKRNEIALDTVWERLVDKENGMIKLFDPPFNENSEKRAGYVASYPEGTRENGGQYTHAAVWYALACFKAGQAERGERLLKMLIPAGKGKEYGREPYFVCADIYTNPLCYGRGGWSMYTGAAGWLWKCVFEGLFGASVRNGKVRFEPCMTKSFDGSEIEMNINGEKIKTRFVWNGDKKGIVAAESGDSC